MHGGTPVGMSSALHWDLPGPLLLSHSCGRAAENECCPGQDCSRSMQPPSTHSLGQRREDPALPKIHSTHTAEQEAPGFPLAPVSSSSEVISKALGGLRCWQLLFGIYPALVQPPGRVIPAVPHVHPARALHHAAQQHHTAAVTLTRAGHQLQAGTHIWGRSSAAGGALRCVCNSHVPACLFVTSSHLL